MEVGRELSGAERQRLRQILRAEDDAQDRLDEVQRKRDAVVYSLRWGGGDGLLPVLPEELIRATVSKRHPRGLSRTTIHRIVGRVKDRPTPPNGSDQSATNE